MKICTNTPFITLLWINAVSTDSADISVTSEYNENFFCNVKVQLVNQSLNKKLKV